MKIRILLADDHKIMRDGLCSLLREQPDMEVVGEAGDGEIVRRLARELKPDVVVMDVSMPGTDGIDSTQKIVREVPDTKIIALSMYQKRSFVEGMLKAGASGYVLKERAFSELAEAIKRIMAGQTYICSEIAGVLVDSYIRGKSETDEPSSAALTPREQEVLQLLADGKNTKQIALQFHISTKTVETHRRQIMQKLDLHSLPELTKYAIRRGLISVD